MEVLKISEWLHEQNSTQFFTINNGKRAIRIKDNRWFRVDQTITTKRDSFIDSGYIISFDEDKINVVIRQDVWSSKITIVPINNLQ